MSFRSTPIARDNFDIAMSGRLEGTGAQLQQDEGHLKVTDIVAGSASSRQGELKVGDVILRVAQGAGEPVSVEGMRFDKAVKLIRGPKGQRSASHRAQARRRYGRHSHHPRRGGD